jgi:hypothetical protein
MTAKAVPAFISVATASIQAPPTRLNPAQREGLLGFV